MNKFKPLTTAPGFRKVWLLENGGVRFERHFFFRWVAASISPNMKYTSCEVHLKPINCFVVLLPSFLLGAVVIFITGYKTKEHLLETIELMIDRKV